MSIADIERTHKTAKLVAEAYTCMGEALTRYGVMDEPTRTFLAEKLKTVLVALVGGSKQSAGTSWTVRSRARHLGMNIPPYELPRLGQAAAAACEARYGKKQAKTGAGYYLFTEAECAEVVDSVIRGLV